MSGRAAATNGVPSQADRRALRGVVALALLAVTVAACEGVNTGVEVARMPLQVADPTGAYVPVQLHLGPEMNPVAINFSAEFSQNPAEFGKWNTYRVNVATGGNMVATRAVHINHPQSRADGASPPPSSTVRTLFFMDVQNSAQYELTMTPVEPVAIVLNNAQVAVRRNVQRSQQ